MNLDVARYLESLESKHSRAYAEAIGDMLVAMARGDRPAVAAVRTRLERIVSETMGIGECLGAASMLRAAAGVMVDDEGAHLRARRRELVAFRESGVMLANVTFQEAVAELVERTPVTLRNAAERTAQRISELYGEGRVVAFARSAEQAVTERVQALIVQAVREGIPEAESGKLISMGVDEVRQATGAWADSYSRMAFRTNLNTAVTAGRFRQAQDPAVRAVAPCFRFDAVGDSDTRDNHEAADGRIWLSSNPVWNRLAPPLGFNCRCQASLVTMPELRRMGRVKADGSIVEDSVPPGAHADPGFRHGGRPDLFIVGVAS